MRTNMEITVERYIFFSSLGMILGIYNSWYSGNLHIYFLLGALIFSFRKKEVYIVLILLSFAVGNLYSSYFLNNLAEDNLKVENKEISLLLEASKGKSYIGKILNSQDESLFKRKIIFYYPSNLVIGEIYQGNFTMENFDEVRIPNGFNEKMYQYGNNVFYKGKLKKIENIENKKSIYSTFLKYRQEIMEKYIKKYTGKAQGLVQAIIFGDKSLFSQETRDSFQLLGISHLLAVSGLHGGIIAAGAYKIFSPGGFYCKTIAACFFLALYAFLAGFSPSINRAALMFFIFCLARIFLRYPDPLTIIAISAIPQILINPFVVFSVGFQLSYITVLGIYFFHKNKKSSLSLSLGAILGTIPILILYFNKVSLIGVFINLFYVPLFAMITLLSMLGLFLPFLPVWNFFDYALNLVIQVTEKIAEYFQFLDFSISTPNFYEIILYYVLIYFLYNKKKVEKRLIISLLALLLLFNFYPKKWELTFLDVGQGDSAFISTYNEKIILIDGGPWGKEVEGFLSSKGINRPELYIVSHPHEDHINGIISLMESKAPKNLLLPINSESNEPLEELLRLAKKKKVNIIYGFEGQSFFIDNTKFEILSPSPSQAYTSCNNQSLVILVSYKNKNILFTGDIEREILDSLYTESFIDILKVPHHGSNTGSSQHFFENMNVGLGVISCGENNKHGHPGKELIKIFKERKIEYLRTDLKGTISFIYKGKKEFYYKTILD